MFVKRRAMDEIVHRRGPNHVRDRKVDKHAAMCGGRYDRQRQRYTTSRSRSCSLAPFKAPSPGEVLPIVAANGSFIQFLPHTWPAWMASLNMRQLLRVVHPVNTVSRSPTDCLSPHIVRRPTWRLQSYEHPPCVTRRLSTNLSDLYRALHIARATSDGGTVGCAGCRMPTAGRSHPNSPVRIRQVPNVSCCIGNRISVGKQYCVSRVRRGWKGCRRGLSDLPFACTNLLPFPVQLAVLVEEGGGRTLS